MLPAINLRTRSTFSLMQSSLDPSEVVKLAKTHDQPAAALIDRHTLAGTFAFAKAAKKSAIQGIVGYDVATETGDLTLIAANETGWQNLLATSALVASSPNETVSLAALGELSSDVIALAGRPGSALANLLNDEAAADAWLRQARDIYGTNIALEIDRGCGRLKTEAALNDLAIKHDIAMIGTALTACSSPDSRWALDLLCAIEQKRTLEDPKLERPGQGLHYLSPDHLRNLFSDAPHLLDNAAHLAMICDASSLPASRKPRLPRFPSAHGDEIGMLRAHAAQGYAKRLQSVPAEKHRQYQNRLETELDIICAQGFAGYFLIVADFIGWSKRNDIPVGPGRGSGAGSAVAWALGITDLDPIRWGLLFERFINPDRVSLPDFDVDFCQTRREETIAYVRKTYGNERVVAIGTHGTWGARSAFRDAARALGISNGAANAACDFLPRSEAFNLTAKPDEPGYMPPEAIAHFKGSPMLYQALEMAEPMQGYIRQHGRHAAGIIIADDPIASLVPVMRDPGGSDDIVTQYDMKEVEDSGLVKFDFLGLKTTTIIAQAVKHVRANDPACADLDILTIPFEDDETFAMLNEGACQGVFQLESEGMVKSLKQVKPSCFEDLIALVSLYRPGPMENIPAYANRKAGAEPIQLPHPKLAPVLEETMGIIVYQEQVMQAARLLAGYTLAEADLLRRAMGKKIQAEMDAQKTRFIEGAGANGIAADRAAELFALIDKFAGYGFNKSHAAAYALLLWQCAWLKRHHPAAFYASALTYADGDFARMRQIIREAKSRQIQFLPPHYAHSKAHFTPEQVNGEWRAVRWGLAGIKGLGSYGAMMATIVAGRTFKRLPDLAKAIARLGNASTQIRALAASGALDDYDTDRNLCAEHLIACIRFYGEQSTASQTLFELDPPRRPTGALQSIEERRNAEIACLGLTFDEHPLADATMLRRLADAVQLRYIDDFTGCGAVTALARVDRAIKAPRASVYTHQISDGTAELECSFDTALPENEVLLIELARKPTENRWRVIAWKPCDISRLPARMTLEISPIHDWEAIREILTKPGRGTDRVDILVNFGERKHRKVVPACFTLTSETMADLRARSDVMDLRIDQTH